MLSVELKFDLFLYYTAWICWHFNFAINVWDHKLLWYVIYKLWTLYNFCHAGCWHILLRIKNKTCCQRPLKRLLSCVQSVSDVHQEKSANLNSTLQLCQLFQLPKLKQSSKKSQIWHILLRYLSATSSLINIQMLPK